MPKAPGARLLAARERHERLLLLERELWSRGAVVAGLDEVGAGPWAGPVTAGCVVLDPGKLEGLLGADDSKKLSAKQRDALAIEIRASARAWAVEEATVDEIDRLNIRVASMLAMERALRSVRSKAPDLTHLMIDAHQLPVADLQQRSIPHGDATSLSIAAASILAKVDRDAKMHAYAATYPHHGFDRHMGYGTAEHKQAIASHGLTPLHRRSFAPIRELVPVAGGQAQQELFR